MRFAYNTYDWSRFPRGTVTRAAGRPNHHQHAYCTAVTAFDIETTRLNVPEYQIEDQMIMYVWQWAIEEDVIFGRTWDDFLYFIEELHKHVPMDCYLVCYVHNLSFEFFYLRGIIDFDPDTVFSVSPRSILRAEYGGWLEFRCSRLHSGYGLDEWLKSLKVPALKMPDFDYLKIRYPWTPLTEDELVYCEHDVLGPVQAIHAEMERDHDTLATIPLTSTGYIRRELKRAIRANVPYARMRDIQPDYPLYEALKEAFRGGNTHASRWYSGRIIKDVGHVDRSSSYPDVLCHHLYPMGRWQHVTKCDTSDVIHNLDSGYAMVMRISFTGLRIKDDLLCGCPYLSVDRVRDLPARKGRDTLPWDVYREDNGRLLRTPHCSLTCTDIDLDIILRQYDYDQIKITEYWKSRYGELPSCITEIIKEHYRRKTQLKGVVGREAEYAHSKGIINAAYGQRCAAQDPAKLNIIYDPDQEGLFALDTSRSRADLLEQYVRKGFLPYSIGVFCTSWARAELQEMIDHVGLDFIYCDTDSIFYANPGKYNWDWYNSRRQLRALHSGAWATDCKGVDHYMGTLEVEPRCVRFATLGAKKYCEEWAGDPNLHITIAGLNKEAGAVELMKRGGMERFVDCVDRPLTFTETGKLAAVYNDDIDVTVEVDGHRLRITPNACLVPTEYTLSVTPDYAELIEELLPKLEMLINSVDNLPML